MFRRKVAGTGGDNDSDKKKILKQLMRRGGGGMHALPKLEGEYMPCLIYVYSIQIFRVLDHSHDHTSLYHCHPKIFLYYALGKEDTTGICLQRNLKITLSQFHSFAAVSVFSDWQQNVKQDRKSFITLSKFKFLMCLCL